MIQTTRSLVLLRGSALYDISDVMNFTTYAWLHISPVPTTMNDTPNFGSPRDCLGRNSRHELMSYVTQPLLLQNHKASLLGSVPQYLTQRTHHALHSVQNNIVQVLESVYPGVQLQPHRQHL